MTQTTKASVRLTEGYRFVASNDRGHSVVLDTKHASGGSDAGPTPMEMVLMAYGGCTGIDVVHILRKKRQDLHGLRIGLSGTRADEDPRIYERIEIEYVFTGGRLDTRAIEAAIRLSEEKYCSVRAMLEPKVKLTSTYRIEESTT